MAILLYILTRRGEIGPVDRPAMRDLLRDGSIQPDDQVRTAFGRMLGPASAVAGRSEPSDRQPATRCVTGSRPQPSGRRAAGLLIILGLTGLALLLGLGFALLQSDPPPPPPAQATTPSDPAPPSTTTPSTTPSRAAPSPTHLSPPQRAVAQPATTLVLVAAGIAEVHLNGVRIAAREPLPDGAIRINAGGPSIGDFSADNYKAGGKAGRFRATVDATAVSHPAPAGVYLTERYGDMNWSIPGLPRGESVTVRLHFCESWFSEAGKRRFNLRINDNQVLTDFDILSMAGGAKRVLIREFPAIADQDGRVRLDFSRVVDQAKVDAIEVVPTLPLDNVRARAASVFTDLPLRPGRNLLAVKVGSRGGRRPGLLFALQGNGLRVDSGARVRTSRIASLGWEQSDFDDAAWSPASEFGLYGNDPWGKGIRDTPSGLTAQWIWTHAGEPAADEDGWFRIAFESPPANGRS